MTSQSQSSNLDLLRSLAVLLVVFQHLLTALDMDTPAVLAWGLHIIGVLGVMMFFIHTSLVLMFSLDRLQRDGAGATSTRFYIRRFFRIYPLSILTVLAVVILRIPPFFGYDFAWPTLGLLLSNLFLVMNLTGTHWILGPLWSLPYEVQMYVVLPFMHFLTRRWHSIATALWFVAAGVAVKLIARAAGYPELAPYAPWFCMGVAAYVCSREFVPRVDGRWFVAFLALLPVIFCVGHRFIGTEAGKSFAQLAECFVFAMTLPHFKDLQWPLVKRVSHELATYSYAVYLCHVPVLMFAFQKLAGRPMWMQAAIFLLLMIALPLALYHFIEAPMIRVGHSIAQRIAMRSHSTTT